jgi:hypothetical protein
MSADNGIFTATLTVADSLGAAGVDSLLVTVTNVAPSLAELPDVGVNLGEIVSFTSAFSDPGLLDTHTVTIEWQAGEMQVIELEAGVLEFSGSYLFEAPGTYPVAVSVNDKDEQPSRSDVVVQLLRIFCRWCLGKTWHRDI